MLSTIPSQYLSSQATEEQAINKIALDYIEGWYSADKARMAKALSTDLKKRGFMINPKTNQINIYEASYFQMIENTGKKSNELIKNPEIIIEVKIMEISKNIAMVKTVTPEYIDYLHMGKLNGEWKIYNVIWEPNYNNMDKR